MKKIGILLVLITIPLTLFAWTSMHLKGEFNVWTDVTMIESVDHNQDWFWPYKATSTDGEMQFLFSADGNSYDATHKYGDNESPGHNADLNGSKNCYIATSNCQTEGESYIITFVTDGGEKDLNYDQSHIESFKIEGNPAGGWGTGNADAMTEVDDPTNGDYWTFTFNVSATGDKYFRLWPNGVEDNWGANWAFAPVSDTEISLDNQTTVTIGNEDGSGAYFFNANSTGNYTISVRPHDRIVLVEKGSDSTLPVVLTTFTAQYVNNQAQLYWRTQTETDNIGWNVYRANSNDYSTSEQINGSLIDGYGTTTEPHDYTFADNTLQPQAGSYYYYWIENIDLSGQTTINGPTELYIPPGSEPGNNTAPAQEHDGLYDVKNNPFQAGVEATAISFTLQQKSAVDLSVFNVKGQLVRELYNGFATGKDLTWDGKDDAGKLQQAGVYLYRLQVNDKVYDTQKVILVR